MILYTYFILFSMLSTAFNNNIEIKYGMEDPIPYSVGLRLFTEISNNDNEDCIVDVFPVECCLDSNDNNCDIIEIIGGASEVISGGATKTITLVAPLLDQFERKGHCTVYIDSSPTSSPKDIARDTVKIKFDTKLKIGQVSSHTKLCDHIDEDLFNDCKPVACETYYNGKKSHYSVIKRCCVPIPTCLPNNTKVPKSGYNPISNKCIDKEYINENDIKIVQQLAESNNARWEKDLIVIEMVNDKNRNDYFSSIEDSTFDDFEEEYKNRKDLLNNKKDKTLVKKYKLNSKTNVLAETDRDNSEIENHLTTTANILTMRTNYSNFNHFLAYVSNNKYAMMILSTVVVIQCFLICTMVYCMSRNCGCCKKKHKIKKIYNYRQDASVTTPLIGTNNIDTETTEYQYLSESSNCIDKKIKCYKACQKERKNNIKLSMSDDILSKCINRRDWRMMPTSDIVPEAIMDEETKSKEDKVNQNKPKNIPEVKVNFQEEYITKLDEVDKSDEKDSIINVENVIESSKREIRCHSYDSNLAGLRKISTTFGIYNQEKKQADSIEKSAQIYFSNDSIEDYLSERGVVFIGDNASKYSFTSLSSAAKSTSSIKSSKTSKNNIFKNVMSLLSKKSKGPTSDPGLKKSKADLDLKLQHISTASIFTSNKETDEGKDIKRTKDSKSSL